MYPQRMAYSIGALDVRHMYCSYIHNIYGGIPDALLMLLQHLIELAARERERQRETPDALLMLLQHLIELAARSHPRFAQLHTHKQTKV